MSCQVVGARGGLEHHEHLAAAVPSRRAALGKVAGRLVDLLPIVRDHVYHPDFLGSFSQKSVLPALCRGSDTRTSRSGRARPPRRSWRPC